LTRLFLPFGAPSPLPETTQPRLDTSTGALGGKKQRLAADLGRALSLTWPHASPSFTRGPQTTSRSISNPSSPHYCVWRPLDHTWRPPWCSSSVFAHLMVWWRWRCDLHLCRAMLEWGGWNGMGEARPWLRAGQEARFGGSADRNKQIVDPSTPSPYCSQFSAPQYCNSQPSPSGWEQAGDL
jgi:hypothetical protein